MADTIDEILDELIGDFGNFKIIDAQNENELMKQMREQEVLVGKAMYLKAQAKAKLQALLLRERKAELQDALTLFSSGEMKQHMVNRIAELSRLSGKESHE